MAERKSRDYNARGCFEEKKGDDFRMMRQIGK